MNDYLLISDAAKEVQVESHVLRYWEEELKLPIKRNEMGHRYYTKEDVAQFKQIKEMKERGLQLKAIKMILKDGQLNLLPEETRVEPVQASQGPAMGIDIIGQRELVRDREAQSETLATQDKEDKARRLQWLLQQMIRETIQENNEILLKELDYQFRQQEEREDERDRVHTQRSEEYYAKMDEILRRKSSKKWNLGKKRKQTP